MKFALIALFAVVAVASANPGQKAAAQQASAIAAEQHAAKMAAKSSDYDSYGSTSYQSDYARPGKLHHKCTCICPAPYRKTYAVQQTYSQPQYVDSRSEAESDKHQLQALLQAMGSSSGQAKAAAMQH